MIFQYETLYGSGRKKSFLLISDFKPEESNRIITDLVRKIEQYEQGRIMQTNYNRVMTDIGERIVRAKMNSEDGVVQGVITYGPPCFLAETNAEVTAKFDFKSEDESLKSEYQGLAKILREM